MFGGLKHFVLRSIAVPLDSLVCPGRSVVVTNDYFHDVEVVLLIRWSLFGGIDFRVFPRIGRDIHVGSSFFGHFG